MAVSGPADVESVDGPLGAANSQDLRALHQHRPRTDRGSREPGAVPSRMECAGKRLQQPTVVSRRADLLPQLTGTEHDGLVPEMPAERHRVPFQISQMARLGGQADPALSSVAAVDCLARDQRLELLDGLERRGEQRPGPIHAVAPQQLLGTRLVAREDEPAVPSAGSPAGAVPLQHRDRGPVPRQGERGGEPGVARSHDRHVGPPGQRRARRPRKEHPRPTGIARSGRLRRLPTSPSSGGPPGRSAPWSPAG